MNTEAYQKEAPPGSLFLDKKNGQQLHARLNGDEVFAALAQALGLPNVTGPAMKPTVEVRFPPPPKSTRDIVADKFGFDPSLCPEEVFRTMAQAMLLMNNKQIQAQINAQPRSGTLLAKLLVRESDDRKAFVRLFRQVMARQPTDEEIGIALAHVREVGRRGAAFEDILWSLVNSAEFTARR